MAVCDARAGVNVWTALGPDGGPALDVELPLGAPGTMYAIAASGFHRWLPGAVSWELTKQDFGSSLYDVAVDPTNSARVLVASSSGVFTSVDGGATFVLRRGESRVTRVETSRDGATAYFASGPRVFRSQDRGDTWLERTAIPGASADAFVTALEVEPAGTVYASAFGLGVFASQDGAGTWQPLGGSTPALSRTYNLVVDPSDAQRLLAATHDGLFTSGDRGLAWSSMPSAGNGSLSDVDVDPSNPLVIYTTSLDRKVSKTVNGGAAWSVLQTGVRGGFAVPGIAIDPNHTANLAAFGGDGVMTSADAGDTWTKRVSGLRATSLGTISPAGRRLYFGMQDAGVLYFDPGGLGVGALDNAGLAALAPELFGVAVFAQGGATDTVYAILNAGVTVVKTGDGGAHWTSAWPASSGIFVQGLASPELEPQTLYAATTAGIYKSFDGGGSWTASNAGLPADFSAEAVAVAPTRAVVYASGAVTLVVGTATMPPVYEHRIYKSLDAGASWSATSIAPESTPLLPLIVDPRDAQTVYTSTVGFGRLRKTTDGGATWSNVDGWLGTPSCCFVSLAFDPVNPNVRYVLFASGVARTVDDGATWEKFDQSGPGMQIPPASLALDPTDASTLLVTTGGLGLRTLTVAPDLEVSLGAVGVTFTQPSIAVIVLNKGPYAATKVRVTVDLPASASNISVSSGAASCSMAGVKVTCEYDSLPASATPATFSIRPTLSTDGTIAASVAAAEPDPVGGNNSATMSLPVNAAPAPPPSPSPSTGGGGGGSVSLEWLVLLAGCAAGARKRSAAT